ncbi:MAG: hydroxyisourate hydrolase [Pseudomonadota bacterium]
MPGTLTTEVIDTERDCAAAGLRVTLYALTGEGRVAINMGEIGIDGQGTEPLLPEDNYAPGIYEIVFHAGDYQSGQGAQPKFINTIPVRFELDETCHNHLVLSLASTGYSVAAQITAA